jgi:serine/threonine-protein kinase
MIGHNVKRLFNSLKKNWELLEFITNGELDQHAQSVHMAICLAFWLAKPYLIVEIIHELIRAPSLDINMAGNALFALIKLGRLKLAESKLNGLLKRASSFEEHIRSGAVAQLELIRVAIQCGHEPLKVVKEYLFKNLPKKLDKTEMRVIIHLMEEALRQQQTKLIHSVVERLQGHICSLESQIRIDCYQVWAYLLEKNWNAASEVLHRYPLEQLTNERTLLHFLYGCWLYVTESKDIAAIHFASVLDVLHPHSWTLFSHFFNKKDSERLAWLQKAFLWEKRQLYWQSALFFHCKGDEEKFKVYCELAQSEYLDDVP